MHSAHSALRLIAAAFLFLLLLPQIEAKPTHARMNVSMQWIVRADGVLDNTTIEVSIPSDSANQRIISQQISDPYTAVTGSDGSRIRFEFGRVRSKLITGNFIVETNYVDRNSSAGGDIKDEYLANTSTVIMTPEIKAVADTFSGRQFPLNLVGMMNWTFSNVKYNLSYTDVTVNDIVGVTMSSDWVFKNRVGVCDELSTLFAAMARSEGYYTGLITGYAFTDGKWIPHAWTDVYVPKYGWIEIDPTHNQFLNLNALRVRIGKGADMTDLADSINATTYDAKSVTLDVNTDIAVLNSGEDEAVTMETYFLPQPPLQSTQPVIVKARNRGAGPVYTSAMFVPPMTVDCDQCVASMFLEPNETKDMDLTLTLPQMSPNVKYTYPSTVMTDYGRKDVSFDRVQIEQSIEEKYASVEDLPVNFKLFLGLFMIGAVALVVIAILLKW